MSAIQFFERGVKKHIAMRCVAAGLRPLLWFAAVLLVLGLACSAAGQQAYYAAQGHLTAAGGQQDFLLHLSRSVGSTETLRFVTYTYSGGTNAAGDIIPASLDHFDSVLRLYDFAALLHGYDDQSGPGYDALLSWPAVQPYGTPLNPDPLTAGDYRLNLREYYEHPGPWAVDLIGPADALGITGFTATGSDLESLKYGTSGAGTASASVNTSSSMTVADTLCVGLYGRGALNVTAGATLTAGELTIADWLGSEGTATISGDGSTCNITTYTVVGNQGAGTLDIRSGATVNCDYQATIGFNAGSTGTVNVTGPNAVWNVTDSLYVGYAGQGTLNVSSGGDVSVDTGIIGLDASGTVTVSGTGSGFICGDALAVGEFAGLGTLLIEAGGFVVSTNSSIGVSAGSTGSVTVTGKDSQWLSLDALNVGGYDWFAGGTADLVLQDRGVVTAWDVLRLWPGGTVTIDGGRLELHGPIEDRGGAIEFIAGAIETYDPTVTLYVEPVGLRLNTISLNRPPLLGHEHELNIAGDTVITSGAKLDMPGGMLITDALTIATAASLDVSGGFVQTNELILATGASVTCMNGLLYVPGPTQAAVGSRIDITGGYLSIGHPSAVNGVLLAGEVRVRAGVLNLYDANDAVLDSGALVTLGEWGQPGTVNAEHGLTLDFGGNIAGYGDVNTPDDPFRPTIINGHVTGDSSAYPITLTGYVKGVGTFDHINFTGTFAPGFSTATVYMGSAAYAGTLEIELGGAGEGQHDMLRHSGAVILGGTLEVSLLNGFVPMPGSDIAFLMYAGQLTGGFAGIENHTGYAGLIVGYASDADSVWVTFGALAGDLNLDGFVGIADLNIVLGRWNQQVSPGNWLLGDPTGDGFVGIADLNQVLGNWNAGTPPTRDTNAPESGTAVLLTLTAIARLGRRCR